MEDDKIHEIVAEIRNALVPIQIALDMPHDVEVVEDGQLQLDRVVQLLKQLVKPK